MIVVLLVSSQPKKVGRWLSPSLMKVATGGITGIRVRPALSDWTYVVKISEPLGKLFDVSPLLSLTMMTSTARWRSGQIGLLWRDRPPSVRSSSVCAETRDEWL